MKKLLIGLIFLLFHLLPMQVFAQKVNHLTTGSLIDALTQDSTFVISTNNNFRQIRVFRSDTDRDTIYTRWIYVDGLNADFTLEFGFDNIIGRDSVTLNFEAFRGLGIPDTTGISVHALETFTEVNDTTKTYHLSDSTFVSKRLFSKYRFSLFELSAQQNDYLIYVNHYSPLGKQPIVRNE